MTQARTLAKPFLDLRRAVAADDIVRALEAIGFTQRQIADAAGATRSDDEECGANGVRAAQNWWASVESSRASVVDLPPEMTSAT